MVKYDIFEEVSGNDDLEKQDKFLQFKCSKLENKYQKWICSKRLLFSRRFTITVILVEILLTLNHLRLVLEGIDSYENLGKMLHYLKAGIMMFIDLKILSTLRLVRFQGILTCLIPFTTTIFRLFFFHTSKTTPNGIGIWLAGVIAFGHAPGFWIYRYLSFNLGALAMTICLIVYRVEDLESSKTSPGQLLIYWLCVFVFGMYSVGHYLEKERKEQFINIWKNKKQLKLIRRMNERIKNEIRKKEEFFACMSHELRNPLNSLLGSLELIIGTKIINMDVINSAQLCGETLLNLIGNILDFSKIETKRMEIHTSATDLREAIKNSLEIYQNLTAKKSLVIKYMADDSFPPALLLDYQKFAQVMTNLIGNSIKFTEKGGIHVNLEWYPIPQAASTDHIQSLLKEVLSYSSREDLKNFSEEFDPHENKKQAPSDVPNYIFTHHSLQETKVQSRCNEIDKEHEVVDIIPLSHIIRPIKHSIKKSIISLWREEYSIPNPLFEHQKNKSLTNNSQEENIIESNLSQEYLLYRSRTAKSSLIEGGEGTCTQGIAKIEISDTGIGISKENQLKLFHPFAQAENSISENFGGTGLGLWISQSIIKMMGGQIEIESEVGEGSNFLIALPLTIADEKKVIKCQKVRSWKSSKNKFMNQTCLFVEDQMANQLLMKEILIHLGFKYKIAKNGLEGYKEFISERPKYFDVIITDLRMSIMSGKEMISKIRTFEEDSRNKEKVPIIVTTGDPNENERKKCIDTLGANLFINKPIKFEELYANLQLLLSNSSEEEYFIEESKEQNLYQKGAKINADIYSPLQRILVIEDDKFLNSILTQFIQSAGYVVDQSYTKIDAIKKINENGLRFYDLISIDSQLHETTGVETLDGIIAVYKKSFEAEGEEKISCPPIISISGDSIEKQKEIYKNYNISDYLQKPISKQFLIESIKGIFTKK